MHSRLSWLDSNMPGNCDESYGIAETEAKNIFTIYPNPVSEYLNITFQTTQKSAIGITIINQQGLILSTTKTTSRTGDKWSETLDISSYKPGVYLLKITIDGKSYTQRFIKI